MNTQSQEKAKSVLRNRTSFVYREVPGLRHETKDVLKQLHANIELIDDMSRRLSFVLNEVRTLVR